MPQNPMEITLGEASDLRLTLSDQASEQERDFIDRQIKSFNDATSEPHRLARQTGTEPLDFMLRDDQDRIRGGLVARTYWGWMEVTDFWIEAELRGHGLGRKLLAAAEASAATRGCSWIWTRTFSHQAKGFYEKQGYRVVGRLEDYPPGGSFYWLRKDL